MVAVVVGVGVGVAVGVGAVVGVHSMKPLVIYHANCADGFGAAYAAWLKLGDEAEYVPMKYGEQPTDFAGRDVYVLDFSFPREVTDNIFANAARTVWLDHHKTAFEMWCGGIPEKGWLSERWNCTPESPSGNVTIELDNNHSGALIAWEYFHPDETVPLLIEHIDDYDRWQFKVPGTKEFSKALWSYAPWSFEQWKTLRLEGMHLEGSAILRAHDQNVQGVVKSTSRKCVVGGFEGLASNCPAHLTSDVGHDLATASGTFGLCWTLKKEGLRAACSLRSNGDYDVSAIAKVFGGGGHRNAAGFEVELDTLIGWLL